MKKKSDSGKSDIKNISIGYDSINKMYQGFIGYARFELDKHVSFSIEDRWNIMGEILDLSRKIIVNGNASGGFFSGIFIETGKPYSFPDLDYFIPGTIYGGPQYLTEGAPAGKNVFRTGRIDMAENRLTAPMVGVYFRGGTSVAMLDKYPRGQT